MIRLLDGISFLLNWGNACVLFLMLRDFFPPRRNVLLQTASFFLGAHIFNVVVYSNDLPGILWPLLGFILYIIVFYKGKWMERLTAVLVFYPAVIAVNYLTQDAGSRLFFWITDAPDGTYEGWWVIVFPEETRFSPGTSL